MVVSGTNTMLRLPGDRPSPAATPAREFGQDMDKIRKAVGGPGSPPDSSSSDASSAATPLPVHGPQDDEL